MRKRTSRHHVVPISQNGEDKPENVVFIDPRLHNIYHQLFWNRTPQEIINYLNRYFWGGKYEEVKLRTILKK